MALKNLIAGDLEKAYGQQQRLFNRLFLASQKVLAGLNRRIELAPKNAVPVFDGIAELHDAIESVRSARRALVDRLRPEQQVKDG